MKILVTNDDGIHAPGLRVLVEFARTLGDVTVVAPGSQQSACSMSINLKTAFEVKPSDVFPGTRCFEAAATPADCVRFAVCYLKEPYDLVLSGINDGMNIGHDIAYSATCAAVFEASFWNIPALAVSTQGEGFADCSAALPLVWEYMQKHRLWESGSLYNVNIPPRATGIGICRVMDKPFYLDVFKEGPKDHYLACGYCAYEGGKDLTQDLDACNNGIISVTPMTTDRTDHKVLAKVKSVPMETVSLPK